METLILPLRKLIVVFFPFALNDPFNSGDDGVSGVVATTETMDLDTAGAVQGDGSLSPEISDNKEAGTMSELQYDDCEYIPERFIT